MYFHEPCALLHNTYFNRLQSFTYKAFKLLYKFFEKVSEALCADYIKFLLDNFI